MKIKLYLLFLLISLLFGGRACATQTVAQHNLTGACGTSSSCAITVQNNVSAGNTLVCLVLIFSNTINITGCSDNNSETYTQAGSTLTGNIWTSNARIAIFYFCNIGTSPNAKPTITATASSAVVWELVFFEITNTATTGCFDQSNGTKTADTGAANNPFSSGNVTTTYANEMLIGWGGPNAATTNSAGSGYTLVQDGTFFKAEEKVVTATCTCDATMSSTTANTIGTLMVATFRDSSQPASGKTIRVTQDAALMRGKGGGNDVLDFEDSGARRDDRGPDVVVLPARGEDERPGKAVLGRRFFRRRDAFVLAHRHRPDRSRVHRVGHLSGLHQSRAA
jgi:hypothetical protein